MTYDAHKNFAYSTVATPPAPALTGTALIVAAGEGSRFPAVSFNAVVWPAGANPLPTNAEVVRVSAGPPGSDTFTIARAQEGSSARAIVAGDQIANAITAKALTDIESGGFGAPLTVFDSTLGADTASIDTGAGAIPGGFPLLEAFWLVRTDDAAAAPNIVITLNNDTGAKYDLQVLTGSGGVASAGTNVGQTSWVNVTVHGSGGTASYAASGRLLIPGYADTTFFKTGEIVGPVPDSTAGNQQARVYAVGFRDTAAITRLKIAGTGAAKLRAGSRLIVTVR